MNYKNLAKDILQKVGGSGNVENVWHCATRLRFKLKDESLAQTKAIEETQGVVTVVQSAGQYQIVIGNSVAKVYEEIAELIPSLTKQTDASQEKGEKEGVVNRLLAFVSSVFTPFLGPLAASGILKGFLVLATTTGLMTEDNGAYQIWSAVSDAIFYFLPLFIAFTAAKRLRVNQYVAVTIAASLVYPSLVTLLSQPEQVDFFGIPIQSASYSASVIPILLAIWLLSYLEPFLDRLFPEAVRNIFSPLLALMIMVPLTLIVVGPVGNSVSTILAGALGAVYAFSPLLAGFILGGIHQVIVIFGVHWALITLMINNISEFGQDPWLPIVCIAVFAQAGAALGVFLRTKDKRMKSLSGSAFITAIFSITEPAIYGVNLKLKKPMAFALISSAIGGGIAGFGEVKASTFTFPGILAIPTYLGEGFAFEIIGLLVGLLLAATLTYFFGGVNDTVGNDFSEETKTDFQLPVTGELVEMAAIKDPVFSTGAMGRGLGIIPKEDILRAPFDGEVAMVFPTRHAIGLISDTGLEVLIHVGIETVQLDGRYFEMSVKAGEQIKQGQQLLTFDREAIRQAGYDDTVIVVFTNEDEEKKLSIDLLNELPVQLDY